MDKMYMVFCTMPSESAAHEMAAVLVEKKLAACCTIIEGTTSVYIWEGTLEKSAESLLLIKTGSKKYDQLEKEIKMRHPYTVPEIVAIPVEEGSQAYMDWVMQTTGSHE